MGLQSVTLFFYSAVVLYNECVGTRSSFTHDFNTGLHGWTPSEGFWTWSKYTTPDLAAIPSFTSNASYVWTERPERGPFSMTRTFHSRYIHDVSSDTKFYIRYWYYTADPMGADHMMIYLMGTNSSQAPLPMLIINQVTNTWVDAVIDCQLLGCCDYYGDYCSLQMAIRGSVGTSGSDGLVAIRCVSTIANGCDGAPETTTTEVISPEDTTTDATTIEDTTTEATSTNPESTITTTTSEPTTTSPPTTTSECPDSTCTPDSTPIPTEKPTTSHVTQTPDPNASAHYSIPSYLIVVFFISLHLVGKLH